MEILWQDLRYAARMLGKNLGFTAVAVFTLALGIGANTAIFSVINGVLLRPLPYKDPGRLTIIWNDYGNAGQSLPAVSPPDYRDYVQRSKLFEEFGAASGSFNGALESQDTTGEEAPEKVVVGFVSANLFSMLGVQPVAGRFFATSEDVVNGPNVAILSYRLWQRRFGGDPSIVGKGIRISQRSVTVVGVLPPDFRLLLPAEALSSRDAEIWRPMQLNYDGFPRNLTTLTVFGRLRKGVTLPQAQSEMDGIAAQLRQENPVHMSSGLLIRVVPLHFDIVKNVRLLLLVLMGAVAFVLLIACGNVANLLLARATARQKEIAIRTALGAGRARIIRQVLTEAILLSLVGGAVGVLLAEWGVDLLLSLHPARLPRLQDVHVDSTVLLFCFGACLLTGILFGLAQALPAVRSQVAAYLNEGTKGSGSAGHHPARNILVIAEISMSLMLLLGAGLLIHSFFLLARVRPGFDPGHVLTLQINSPIPPFQTFDETARFYQQLEDKLAALPGVQAVGAISQVPLTGSGAQTPYAYNAETEQKWESISADWRNTTPDYFRVMGIRLAAGRFFNRLDDTGHPRVVIVDDTLARQAWPGQDPIGKRMQIIAFHSYNSSQIDRVYADVVGVVEHPRIHDLSKAVRPQIYTSQYQQPFGGMTLVVKATGEPQTVAKTIEDGVHVLNRTIFIHDVRTMNSYVSDVMAPRRFSLIMVLIFGILALALSTVGLYGVIAYSVSQRTHEIGIRMALGAEPKDVLRLIVGQGLTLALTGVAIGLLGGVALTHTISGLLYGVSATDLPTYATGAVVVALVALGACYVPARRASKLHPMAALRYE